MVTVFGYDTPLGDRQLLSITTHYSTGVQYSQSSYTWRDDDRLETWKQSFGPVGNQTYLFKWEPSYDDAWQLDSVKDLDTQVITYDYAYDSGANRTAEVTPGTSTTWTYANPVNQISTQLQGGTPRTFVHDKNGSITSDGLRTFTWDRARRLRTIDDGTLLSQYEYDGWSRLVKLTETVITTQVSTVRSFLWCGEVICEERDGSGATVVRRFFPYGMQEVVGGVTTSYYTTRDHLGSVRELRDGTGATVARWDYDPFGRPTQIAGAPRSPVMGYTGHLYHAQTGLWLTHFRAYDPALGRWLSRDPIGEAGGVNLYGYVGNDPGNWRDPQGFGSATTGKPNSWQSMGGPNNKIWRHYGPDGRWDRDIHFGHRNHHPGIKGPHQHGVKWDCNNEPEKGEAEEVAPEDIPEESEVEQGDPPNQGDSAMSNWWGQYGDDVVAGALTGGAVAATCSLCPECCAVAGGSYILAQ